MVVTAAFPRRHEAAAMLDEGELTEHFFRQKGGIPAQIIVKRI
jgi:hypothetical protein